MYGGTEAVVGEKKKKKKSRDTIMGRGWRYKARIHSDIGRRITEKAGNTERS